MAKTCARQDLGFEVTIAYCVPAAAVMAVTAVGGGLEDHGVTFYARVRVHLLTLELKWGAFVSEAPVKSGHP